MEPAVDSTPLNLSIELGRLKLSNPILVASGTFGYAREMAAFVDFSQLGGIVPKTITQELRKGNRPPRTVETAAGMLNAIGLDNDGLDYFIEQQLPYLSSLGTCIVVSIAGRTIEEFISMSEAVSAQSGVGALELNISCPNVTGGVDYGISPARCEELLQKVRKHCPLPLIAKLTPNVTSISEMAKAAESGGADVISLINTVSAMAVDWRRRRPILGNGVGGLSGPAIKPIALRCVHQAYQAVSIPLIGIGGIDSIDDVMEFLVCGASAVQIGTANYYDPTVSIRLTKELDGALRSIGATDVASIVGSLELP